MKTTYRIAIAELRSLFCSPVAWLILVIFAVQVGAAMVLGTGCISIKKAYSDLPWDVFVFVYSALLASLAGILTVGRTFTAMMTLGDGAEMDAISAVVLGGTSMNGGRGTIAGTVIGAIVIGVLKNGMNLLGIDSSWQYIVQGIVILIAVYIDWFKQTGFKFSRKIKA